MFLTHIDEEGNDTPAILIENATAADRAVNIPEFVNIPAEGLQAIEVPAADFYRLYDRAAELNRAGEHARALEVWREALRLEPDDARPHNNLGVTLTRLGRQREALESYRRAIELDARYTSAHFNLGAAQWSLGDFAGALRSWEEAARLSSGNDPEILDMLAGAYVASGRKAEAEATARKALQLAEKLGDLERAAAIRSKLRDASR
jgi:Flp pilus assembly protein TadD